MTNDVLNQVIDDYKVLYHTEKEKRQLLQQRIDKAIEIIKREFLCYDNESDEYKWGKILLEILGGNNE